jgi:alpha-L-rhamnosidase
VKLMTRYKKLGVALLIALPVTGVAQTVPLDPARSIKTSAAVAHAPLQEEFIWTRDDEAALDPVRQARLRGQDDKTEPHYFRRSFAVAQVPPAATLYLAGPRAMTVYLNDQKVMQVEDDGGSARGSKVYSADVSKMLHPGVNVLALVLVRGHSHLHTGASPTINQVTYGEVLSAKIVPAAVAVVAAPLVVSDTKWKSTLTPPKGWERADFDDSSWLTVSSIGAMGSKSDFGQWNADAGLYAWPGYSGISSFLRTFRLPVVAVSADGSADRLAGLEHFDASKGATTVAPGSGPAAVVFDFGKELSGRIRFVSASNETFTVAVSYGESREEAAKHPYLAVRNVVVPAHGVAFGAKTGFRYVRVVFPSAAAAMALGAVDAEGIAYPVEYLGSFRSSDERLNRIWETGAYTAHLCMQDSIWDGVKRDRARWMGDLDVMGRVINSVFADHRLMEPTMEELIGSSPVQRDVNTIAGYSALWITGQADYYRHFGNLAYLQGLHQRLVELLGVMDQELDENALFTNPGKRKVFVDWSKEFSADGPEARAATHFEFYLAYREAAYLLGELKDDAGAARYKAQADKMLAASHASLLDVRTKTYGTRWQTNAMAVVSGAASEGEYPAIWSEVLSHVGEEKADTPVVTPYYGYYVLSAMAKTGHRVDALAWMSKYWGGMLDEGATSFWEAYDTRWPKQDFHAYLEADNQKGYYVSLAHGWSSGPTAWLMEEILGIHADAAGFREVTVRPDLAGLGWAEGTEPTPRGLIRVSIHPESTVVTVPAGTAARILLPIAHEGATVLSNGKAVKYGLAENGTRASFVVRQAGRYEFRQK